VVVALFVEVLVEGGRVVEGVDDSFVDGLGRTLVGCVVVILGFDDVGGSAEGVEG